MTHSTAIINLISDQLAKVITLRRRPSAVPIIATVKLLWLLTISDVPSTELLSQLDVASSGNRPPIPPPFSASPQNVSFIVAAMFGYKGH